MALYHPPVKCFKCGGVIPWVPNPMTEYQRIHGFMGDTGGHHDHEGHVCSEKKPEKQPPATGKAALRSAEGEGDK
ncbi:MAG: hypothetical protein HYT22_00875 [Candidatus Niyogibacteria bacterium]|nr:hypothetical protein [Candidatus Niyogibacteria bacterium]